MSLPDDLVEESIARSKAELKEARLKKQAQAWDQGVRKPQWSECKEMDIETFVRYTGGGSGKLEKKHKSFHQSVPSTSRVDSGRDESNTKKRLGFGRVSFPENHHPACYLRIPWKLREGNTTITSNPMALLYFVENVWKLPRPRLLISITGGATNFEMNAESILYQLMATARLTNAWLVTGGSNAGIMKYVGKL